MLITLVAVLPCWGAALLGWGLGSAPLAAGGAVGGLVSMLVVYAIGRGIRRSVSPEAPSRP